MTEGSTVQSYVADPSAPTFAPQSEVDLIENWWRRGGYNETGQSAIERQRALLDLARVRARQLSQPIGLNQLTSVAHIDDLRSDGILQNAREGIDFLVGVLDWTNQKNAPPWVKPGHRDCSATHLFEWTRALGSRLGWVAGLLSLSDSQARFLDPILALEGDNCWALLSPFASTYVCAYVYDAPVVPADAVAMLDLCLGRLFQDSAFKRDAYRSGKFSGFRQPELVRTLMFVSVERADLAARYVNGDWSEINRILPLIDRFVRAGGWAASVMDPFLTLCERARTNYPAEAFADQVLTVIGNGPDNLKGWHGTFIPARIAELAQHFAHRGAPMKLALAQKFLRILDMLVDMGDRRSAALQLGEAFREIRLPS